MGQTISVSGAIAFPSVSEKTPAAALSGNATLFNHSPVTLTVDSLKMFAVYGAGSGTLGVAFQSNLTGGFDVASNSGFSLPFQFTPRHNVAYHTAALVCGSGVRGCKGVSLSANVTYSKGYYSTTTGLSGAALFSALKTKVTAGYISHSYTQTRDQMFLTTDNKRVNGQGASANTVECIYTGFNAVGYTSRTDCQTRFNFNTEHTFPQSLFNSDVPMVSDHHHLFPTLEVPNGHRSNYPFDTVLATTIQDSGGSRLGTNNGQIVYEPRDVQKGGTARALFYFVVRHQDYSGFFAGHQAALRRWALHYPVDSVDLKRNKDVETFQGNRNPFVDYPQLIERLPDASNPAAAFPVISLVRTYPPAGQMNLTDSGGYSFTIVNEGNTVEPVSLPAAPAGFSIAASSTSTSLQPGDFLTFTLTPDPGTAAGVYTYASADGSSISITLADPNAVTPPVGSVRFNVFPNPCDGQVTVSGSATAVIYNRWGQEVHNGPAGVIDVSGLAPGAYFVRANGQSRVLAVVR